MSNIANGLMKNPFFFKLYNDLKKIIDNAKEEKINNNSNIKMTELTGEPPSKYLKDNEFTSKSISTYIKNNLKYSYLIEDKNKNNKIIYFRDSKITSVPKILKDMLFVIYVLKRLFKRDYEQKVIYFETRLMKKFPKNNEILSPDHINSAVTFLDFQSNGVIYLFRREEVIKVLIHELIHSNLIDENIIFSKKNDAFNRLFCVNYKVLLNEAVTETLACIINIFIINIMENMKNKNINKNNKNNKKTRINSMFIDEYNYSNYICKKIKNHYNIEKISDILKANNGGKCKYYFPQQTNVFSYYFLKNVLMNEYNLFGNILDKNTANYKIMGEKANELLIKLIVNNLNKIDNRIDKININDKNNSLKMSLYPLNKQQTTNIKQQI